MSRWIVEDGFLVQLIAVSGARTGKATTTYANRTPFCQRELWQRQYGRQVTEYDPPGPTFLAYTPNGRKLVTTGANSVIRVYETGSDGEPTNIDDCQENNLAVAAANDFFIHGSEDGTVSMYWMDKFAYEKMITRCTLPIRDIALSPDGKWAAIASDELTIKMINIEDTLDVLYFRDCPKPTKHITFHPSGTHLAASCTDGIVYIYQVSEGGQPELVRKIEDAIRVLETDVEASAKAAWHPDGRAIAVPTVSRDIQVISWTDGARQKAFSGGHMGEIMALAWSPNGALLASAAADGKILLWETKSQKVISRLDYANVTTIAWHPYENLASFTTSNGEVFIHQDFVGAEFAPLLAETLQPAPFARDDAQEHQKQPTNGSKPLAERPPRRRTPDSLDDLLGTDDEEEDDFVVDDDGAGYALGLNGNGKRTSGHLDGYEGNGSKRFAGHKAWSPSIHEAFQPGSTPWRGDRRYLCLNLLGFVWTITQNTHNTVTVEFYDREYRRDFHFTDTFLYDKACLNENGTLFSCPPANSNPAMVYYRPHESWVARADWRIKLPVGEDIKAISLSDSFVVVTTSSDYVRVYTLYGTPYRVYRQKSSPSVTCAAWRDYILTIGNGPVGSDGQCKLLYTIENVRRDEVCQNEDMVALGGEGASLRSVFFSDCGDPCIYDSHGVLLVLQHWRSSGQAKWVPLLDTKRLERLASGRKEESYWPVAVARDRFHCIILKGGDTHPYFPRPLLTDFEFQLPVADPERKPPKTSNGNKDGNNIDDEEDEEATATAESAANEALRLEEAFVRETVQLSLFSDLLDATRATSSQESERARRELEVDKVLLQLLNVECRAGEERGPKALETAGLLRDRSGRMLEAAVKIAARYGRTVLEDKIGRLAEKRLLGQEGDDGIQEEDDDEL